MQYIKKAFGGLMENYLNYSEIHLFYAGPAGLAVEIGRLIRETMWPKVFVYNYQNSRTVKYKLKLELN